MEFKIDTNIGKFIRRTLVPNTVFRKPIYFYHQMKSTVLGPLNEDSPYP
jgi:hypothetical protein